MEKSIQKFRISICCACREGITCGEKQGLRGKNSSDIPDNTSALEDIRYLGYCQSKVSSEDHLTMPLCPLGLADIHFSDCKPLEHHLITPFGWEKAREGSAWTVRRSDWPHGWCSPSTSALNLDQYETGYMSPSPGSS